MKDIVDIKLYLYKLLPYRLSTDTGGLYKKHTYHHIIRIIIMNATFDEFESSRLSQATTFGQCKTTGIAVCKL